MAAGLQPDVELGASLFDALSSATRQGRGIVRDSYGAGEQAAHDIARGAAEAMGLETGIDALGNLSMTLRGRDRAAPRIVMGSHLDSVPQGGNFDGAAGVVAGLCVLSGMRRASYVPGCDLTVMGIRAEESAWFDIAYLGSGGAFGLLDPACLSITRSDNGRSLERTLGNGALTPGHPGTTPAAGSGAHPCLPGAAHRAGSDARGPRPAGGGGQRHPWLQTLPQCPLRRRVRALGRGRAPLPSRRGRRDRGVFAPDGKRVAAPAGRRRRSGSTSGELFTDAAMHGPSKIAGETRFVLDIRSLSAQTMEAVAAAARTAAARIAPPTGSASIWVPPAIPRPR